MIEFLNVFLPIVLYISAIIVLIIMMVLGIKLIGILDKVDRVIDNVEEKINSLNVAFSLIDKTTDSLVSIGNTIVGSVTSLVSKVFNRKKFNDMEDDFDE